VTDIGLAVNRVYSTESGEKREEVTFIDVTLWGRTAEVVHQYCKKGRPLFVEGRLQLDTWDDKQTGQKRSKLKVIGDGIQLLGSRESGGGEGASPSSAGGPASSSGYGGSGSGSTAPNSRPPQRESAPSSPTHHESPDDDEDQVPF
jgi:single-strand DNA-binding protein